jgi:hypothetical protein
VMGESGQTPATPEMWAGMRDDVWSVALRDRIGWVEAGTGEPLPDPELMGWTLLEPMTAGRTVLELPGPIQQNERGATWAVTVDNNQTEFASGLHWDDNSPVVETDFALWDPAELRAYCLAGLAASSDALRLASESSGDGENGG